MFSCRGIDALPINVDPIPEDITQGFGLLRLRDVSSLENGGGLRENTEYFNYLAHSYLEP